MRAENQTRYDLGVLIGRFQPFHDAHLGLVRRALERSRRVLVVIGSAGAARRPDTAPFTAEERQAMIEACLDEGERARVRFSSVRDLADDTLWNAMVEGEARAALQVDGADAAARVALFGCLKDSSSYYLEAFPGWALEDVEPLCDGLSATTLRDLYFSLDTDGPERFLADTAQPIPAPVRRWLADFARRPEYRDLMEEWAFAREYRARWTAAPYPPVFVTADAVVVQNGAVLLIERRNRPGRGLWALPGGFLDQDERLADAALRELAEETGLSLSRADWRRALGPAQVFDAPRRDIRGRVVTHAFLFRLPDDQPRPAVAPADDAAQVKWVALADLNSERLYGDHYQIIQTFVRQMGQGQTAQSEEG